MINTLSSEENFGIILYYLSTLSYSLFLYVCLRLFAHRFRQIVYNYNMMIRRNDAAIHIIRFMRNITKGRVKKPLTPNYVLKNKKV